MRVVRIYVVLGERPPVEASEDAITVFIVDDDEAVRESLRVLLESYGIEVETYDSTSALVADASPQPPACLILDQHLNGMTGFDFLTSSERAALDLPVILITGQGDAKIRTRALQLGVSDYLEKPLDEMALLAAIRRAAGT